MYQLYVWPYVVLWHATLFVFWDFVGCDPIFHMLLYFDVLHTYMRYVCMYFVLVFYLSSCVQYANLVDS